ncbi:MAG: PAS domain S-box protein [Thermodesulfobacteriota bacterium]
MKVRHGDYERKALIRKLEKRLLGLEREVEKLRQAESRLSLLSAAVEQSSEGVAIVDLEGFLLYVNPAFAGTHGYSPEELLGKHLSVFHNQEQMQSVQVANRQLQETGKFSGEIWHARRDGSVFLTLMHNTVMRDEKGNPVAMIGTLRDMTESRQAEQRYRNLFEEAPMMYLTTRNQEGAPIITDCNDQFLTTLGYTRAEVVGQPLAGFYSPTSRAELLEGGGYRRAQEHNFVVVERELVARDGRIIHALLHAVPETDTHGRVSGTRAMFVDITKRKQVEEALRQSEERLRLALEAADQGLYDLNLQTGEAVVSPEYARMLGYEPHEFHETHQEWQERLHPEERELICRVFQEYLSGLRNEYRVEYRQKTKGGEWRWILSQGRVVEWDQEGRPLRMLGTHTDITTRKEMEEALIESEERYRQLFDLESDALFLVDSKTGRYLEANRAACALYGYTREELLSSVKATDLSAEPNKTLFAIQAQDTYVPLRLLRKKDGTVFPVEITSSYFQWRGRDVHLAAMRDISERVRAEEQRKRLEEELRQSQKMEALGTLAGGVAHDFNNLLTVITGNADLILLDLKEEHPLYQRIEEIRKASRRAASLTRQLLAFSRRQIIEPRVLSLNDILKGTEKMLGRLIGENIRLEVDPVPDLWEVKIDPGQMEQVILNLAVNAKDAMPMGGRLTMTTRNTHLDASFFAGRGIAEAPGPYVMLEISDTGTGISPEIRERIFDPFFTTKELGKGTGLGLSTVYGIVKQNRGFIFVKSEPGKGTAFEIYLPRTEEGQKWEPATEHVHTDATGSETILLVEDEDHLEKLAASILTRSGYRVLEARNGEDALAVSGAHNGPIHLLLTDVVMPGMNGRELAERITSLRRGIRVLYMSGYTDDAIAPYGILEQGVVLLQKPFTPEALARKVREVLDR